MIDCCATGETIKDYLTGRDLPDCDDEQIRQKMERLLVEIKDFDPRQIEVDRMFDLPGDDDRSIGRAELVVSVDGRPFMLIKSTRGSLVTRERESLAAARLACQPPVPVTVVTNGADAEILETRSGKVKATGLDAIPNRREALVLLAQANIEPLPEAKREKEARIYRAFATFQCSNFCPS